MVRRKKLKREHFVFECGNIHEVWAHAEGWADCMVLAKRVPQIFGSEFKFRNASLDTIQRLRDNRERTFEELYRTKNNEAD